MRNLDAQTLQKHPLQPGDDFLKPDRLLNEITGAEAYNFFVRKLIDIPVMMITDASN